MKATKKIIIVLIITVLCFLFPIITLANIQDETELPKINFEKVFSEENISLAKDELNSLEITYGKKDKGTIKERFSNATNKFFSILKTFINKNIIYICTLLILGVILLIIRVKGGINERKTNRTGKPLL